MTQPRRKSSSDRIEQILDVAEAQVLAGGLLSLNIQKLGEAVGASRTLIYSYFRDDAHLTGALLERHVADLDRRGLRAAVRGRSTIDAALASGTIYLAHIVERGPLLDAVQRDLAGIAIEAAILRPVMWALADLARAARAELDLGSREALAAVVMLTAIPEELGRLVWSGRLTHELAAEMLDLLLRAGIDALRPIVR